MMAHETDNNNLEQTIEQNQQPAATQSTDIDYKTLYQRTNADFQNFKRRTEKERGEWSTLVQSNVIEKIVPIVDDIERAIATAQGDPEWIEGFKLVLKNFKKTLTDLGVEEISTQGAFNPELHEALMHVESPQHTSGDIVQELSKGYTFKGKVVRHARVSVAK